MRFYLSQKDQHFKSLNSVSRLQPVDRSVDRSLKSVDRRAQTCTPVLAGGPVDRSGRPSRELCSLERPRLTDRSTGQRAVLSVSKPRSTGRSTAGSTVTKLTIGRSTGRSTARPTWLQRLVFSSSINLGVWALFFSKIFSGL